MPTHDIIVIGASSGGLKALRTLMGGLPPSLPAAVFVVMHLDPRSPSVLADLLGRAGKLRTMAATDGEPIPYGEVRVAPPDHHLILERERVVVAHGPKENRSRPAIDTLFRSAALAFRTRVIGVVLTGNLDDGTAGLWSIKRAGGIAVVQDPQDAEFPDMPKNARDAVAIDHCVPLAGMAALLTRLTTMSAPEADMTIADDDDVPGVVYVCPECHGPLREVRTGNEKVVRFRCLVGHAYSMVTLLEAHTEARESTLWSALVSLEHQALLSDRAARHASSRNETGIADGLTAEAAKAREQGDVLRGFLGKSARAPKA